MAFLAISLLLFSSCSKDETVEVSRDVPDNVATLYLGPLLGEFGNQTRQQEQDIPDCSTEEPAYAQIKLTYGESNTPVEVIVDILEDDQGLFTAYDEALEIPIPTGETTVSVTLTDFVVWTDNGGVPGTVIWVAPKTGSEFAPLVSDPLSNVFSLRAGSKNYVNVDVICYDDRNVNLYGYQFFDINPVTLYKFCVFANYCNDAGRHYTADYELSLYTYSGEEAEEVPMENAELYTNLYTGESPNTGNDEGTYYADPLCLVIPGPKDGQGPNDPYLYYEISLSSWEPYYTPDEAIMKSGYLTWNQIADLLDVEGDETSATVDYWHIFFNCGDDVVVECDLDDPQADCDGDGVPNGQDDCPEVAPTVDEDGDGCEDETGCDQTDPEADCDSDSILNKCDTDNPNYGTFDCDGDGVLNGQDDCPEVAPTVDEDGDGCEDETGCDQTDPEADCDSDSILNKCDTDNPNYGTFDCDGDGVLNGQDDCPEVAPTVDEDGDGCEDETGCDQTDPEADCDSDSILNKCDTDNPNYGTFDCDGDGVLNGQDDCPEVAPTVDEDGDGCEDETGCDQTNPEADCDSDSILNKCDTDNPNYDTFDCDGDGVNNGQDNCENTVEGALVDGAGCSICDNPVNCYLQGVEGFNTVTPSSYSLELLDQTEVGNIVISTTTSDDLEIVIGTLAGSGRDILEYSITISQDGGAPTYVAEMRIDATVVTEPIVIDVPDAFDTSEFSAQIEVILCSSGN